MSGPPSLFPSEFVTREYWSTNVFWEPTVVPCLEDKLECV